MKTLIPPKFFGLIFILFGFSVFFVSCEMPATGFDEEEPAEYLEKTLKSETITPDSTIRVMTWNIRYGFGRGPWFGDACGYKVIYEKDEIINNLKKIVEKIKLVNPDILLLQEVEINSARSAYVNQLKWILDNTDFNYVVYGHVWKAQFVPSDGLGRVEESNAIYSKWPMKEAKRFQLALRTDQSSIERYFYERSCMVEGVVEIPGFKDLYVVNIHASAFATDNTKLDHLTEFKAELDQIAATGAVFVAGGDLNTLPPESDKTDYCIEDMCPEESFHNQGDNPMHKDGSDYTPEKQWMIPFYENYNSVIPLDQYLKNQEAYFTHTTRPEHFWDRTLDYLFTNIRWESGQSFVRQDFLQESDHAPVVGKLVLIKK
jgi:endonuclease/exonuclease/phosphatase family metal-dependent hydrolase